MSSHRAATAGRNDTTPLSSGTRAADGKAFGEFFHARLLKCRPKHAVGIRVVHPVTSRLISVGGNCDKRDVRVTDLNVMAASQPENDIAAANSNGAAGGECRAREVTERRFKRALTATTVRRAGGDPGEAERRSSRSLRTAAYAARRLRNGE